MDKKEILEVLYEMKADFEKVPVISDCTAGFCYWLEKGVISFRNCAVIIDELYYDKKSHRPSPWWYEKFEPMENYKNSITPRIDHLNRTIARLENELKTEQQNATIQ